VGLDKVTAEDITELLDSHGQQLYNGDLDKQAKEIRQQKEEKNEKDKESPLKCMKTSDLQYVLSAMDTLMMSSVKWTTSGSEVRKCKRSIMVSTGPYSEILKERKRKS
jgi:hypothetical protein